MQRPKSLIFSIILKQKSEKIPGSNTIPEPLKKENFRQPFVFRDKFIFLDNVFQIFTLVTVINYFTFFTMQRLNIRNKKDDNIEK